MRHMLDHAREAVSLTQGKTGADLDRDRLLNLALVRLCEIIGEAASKVPPEARQRHADVPWRQVTAVWNRLIHGYDSVDFDILWMILTGDLPSLIQSLERIIDNG